MSAVLMDNIPGFPLLAFDRRADETVLVVHDGDRKKTVGMYMPSDGLFCASLMLPASIRGGVVRETINTATEQSARMWLVGTYLVALSQQ